MGRGVLEAERRRGGHRVADRPGHCARAPVRIGSASLQGFGSPPSWAWLLLALPTARGSGTICSRSASYCAGSYSGSWSGSSINLFNQGLTGTLPTELGLLSKITRHIRVSSNSISGTLPTQLGLLTQLSSQLAVSVNSISGTLPTQLGLMTKLSSQLAVSHNSISGTLPTQLGLLTKLYNL